MLNNKRLLVALAVSSLSFAAGANPFHLEINPYGEIKTGQQKEYVYNICSDGNIRKLSQLDWEQNPTFWGGINASAGIGGLRVFAGFRGAVRTDSGNVYDYDWLNVEKSGTFSESQYKLKTNKSISPIELEDGYGFNIGVRYEFKVAEKVHLSPFFEYDYNYTSFLATGGEYWYADTNSSGYYESSYKSAEKKYFADSPVLRLERDVNTIWIGANFDFDISRSVILTIGSSFTPWFKVDSLDSHLSRSLFFLDEMEGKFCGGRANVQVAFNLSKHHSFVAGANTLVTSQIKGTTKSSKLKNGVYSREKNSSSACSFEYVNFNFGYRFKI